MMKYRIVCPEGYVASVDNPAKIQKSCRAGLRLHAVSRLRLSRTRAGWVERPEEEGGCSRFVRSISFIFSFVGQIRRFPSEVIRILFLIIIFGVPYAGHPLPVPLFFGRCHTLFALNRSRDNVPIRASADNDGPKEASSNTPIPFPQYDKND